MRRAARVAVLAVLAITMPAFGKGSSGGHSASHSSSHASTHSRAGSHSNSKPSGSRSTSRHRDKNGNVERSEHAKDEFLHSHPCPSTGKPSGSCPGYVIAREDTDDPLTMQWQAAQAPM